ncbi:protein RRP5 homolog [Daphnia carinata]|uniref:protein RRP5 homolog n=1 Tax=Daphnia carinata TaxID=120202 RepID=UPI00257EBCF0|nr:protein RRP5 homolog [Daphnia carinata]
MAIVEGDFPRGAKARDEKREHHAHEKKRKVENLFKGAASKKVNKRRLNLKKKHSRIKKERQELQSLTTKEKKVIEKEKTMLESIEPLTFKMLAEGMQLLSRVQEVREMDVLLSLPGRIQAVVPITNISTPYTDLLNMLAQGEDVETKSLKEILVEGELFPCSIKEVTNDGSFKVTASLNPVDVNSEIPSTALCKGMKITAAVQSVEDHGYVMDLGISNARSFLPKVPDQDYAIGQIISTCVTGCQIDGHVATLTLSTVDSIKFKQNVELNLSTLIPATKLTVTVNKVLPQGLVVTFGNLVGYVHKDHLVNANDNVSSYEKSSNYTAVILYTLPLINAVYLSLKSSLVKPVKEKKEKDIIVPGQFFDAIITESTAVGLFIQLNKTAKGFVPVRHLSDNQDIFEDTRSLFPIKSRKRCRVLNHASVDDIYICTMKKSLLTQKALRYEDFTVGEVLEGKIDSVSPAGISVNLGVNLKGFIPKLHWADDPRLKKPELRFRVGNTITCRVLKVMVDRKNIHLTCKKALLDETVVAYTHPSQLDKNLGLKGTVVMIENNGVLVSFFGDLTGYMPRNRLSKKGISDISRYFYIGQVIDCVVHDIHETGKVTLTLAKPDTEQTVKRAAQPVSNLGSIVTCKVERVFDATDGGSSGLEVSIPSLKSTGFIPVGHLSDFPKLAPHLLHCYRPGQIIEEAVVWVCSKLQTVLTLKPIIVNYIKENCFPGSIEEMGMISVFPCVAARQRSFGIFASLLCPPNKFEVLFPSSQIPEELHSLSEKDVQHLTMEGRVIKVDKEAKKISLSALNTSVLQSDARVLEAFLRERERIRSHLMESSDEGLKYLANLKVGDVVIGKLLADFKSSANLEFELPNGLKAIVPAYHHAKKISKANDLIVGSVLYCDLILRVVYVTTKDDVIKRITGTSKLEPRGNKQKGKILLNTDYFSLVSLVDGKTKDIAFISNIRSINETVAPLPAPFELGVDVDVAIDSDTEVGKIATYHKTPVSWDAVNRSRNKRASSSDDGPKKKKAKKENAAKTNGKESQENVDPPTEVKTKKTQNKKAQKQLSESNGTKETEKSSLLETDKSTGEKKRKGKKDLTEQKEETSETCTNGELKDNPSSANETEAKKAAAKKKKDVPAKKETPVPKGKRSTSENKDKCAEDQKDLSPSKKRRTEAIAESTTKQPQQFNPLALPRLSIASTFKWDDDMTTLPLSTTSQVADSSDSEDEDADKEKAVIKDRRERAREKLEQAKQDEAKLSKIEEELNNPDRAPVTTDDFDRMVLSSPNSSILWLQYMAFHLENAEIEKARTVAQRALKIMSFREEQEKFNVWIAWLNLEHMYGTTEGYEATLQEALRYNEPFKVHRQMALNFEQSGKFDEAESLYTTMLKKYKQNKSVWMNACLFYVRNSKLDTARGVFQRALSILDKKEHVDLISRFGQLEMKFGQLGRGKTLFDTLLMSYPKRTDLWLVYIDTLTKVGDVESARQVLERCITLQLPAKKMKTIFQKFLEFETHHGDEERQDYVRKKALDYVESKTEVADE